MNLHNAGYHFTHGSDFSIHRPHGSGDYMLLILKTPAAFTIAGNEISAPPNSFILYKQGTPQLYRAAGEVFINDWLHFDLDAKDVALLSHYGIPFDTVGPLQDISELSSIIKKMFTDRYSASPYKKETAQLYFQLLVIELAKAMQKRTQTFGGSYHKMLTTLRHDIFCYPARDWSIDTITRQNGISRSYLQHLYKQCFDTTITADITKARIEYAKYLLSSTEMPIRTISAECGFQNEEHFMRVFKREVSLTPSRYRAVSRISRAELQSARMQAPYFGREPLLQNGIDKPTKK